MVFAVLWLILFSATFVTVTSSIFLFADILTRKSNDIPRGFHGVALLKTVVLAALTCFTGQLIAFLSIPFGYFPWRLRKPAPSNPPQTPVVFVHGLYHSSAAWFAYRFSIGTRGKRPTYALTYSSYFRTAAHISKQVESTVKTALAETGHKRVFLVGHSLGGLCIRRFLATSPYAQAVAGVITLGTPHQGSILAHLASGQLGRSIKPEGTLIAELSNSPEPDIPKFCFYSSIDNMVIPGKNLIPCKKGWTLEETATVGHTFLLVHPPVIRRVRAILNELDPIT